ncbi:hypothetical protein D3C72_2166320 [compost metagenome]
MLGNGPDGLDLVGIKARLGAEQALVPVERGAEVADGNAREHLRSRAAQDELIVCHGHTIHSVAVARMTDEPCLSRQPACISRQ